MRRRYARSLDQARRVACSLRNNRRLCVSTASTHFPDGPSKPSPLRYGWQKRSARRPSSWRRACSSGQSTSSIHRRQDRTEDVSKRQQTYVTMQHRVDAANVEARQRQTLLHYYAPLQTAGLARPRKARVGLIPSRTRPHGADRLRSLRAAILTSAVWAGSTERPISP